MPWCSVRLPGMGVTLTCVARVGLGRGATEGSGVTPAAAREERSPGARRHRRRPRDQRPAHLARNRVLGAEQRHGLHLLPPVFDRHGRLRLAAAAAAAAGRPQLQLHRAGRGAAQRAKELVLRGGQRAGRAAGWRATHSKPASKAAAAASTCRQRQRLATARGPLPSRRDVRSLTILASYGSAAAVAVSGAPGAGLGQAATRCWWRLSERPPKRSKPRSLAGCCRLARAVPQVCLPPCLPQAALRAIRDSSRLVRILGCPRKASVASPAVTASAELHCSLTAASRPLHAHSFHLRQYPGNVALLLTPAGSLY